MPEPDKKKKVKHYYLLYSKSTGKEGASSGKTDRNKGQDCDSEEMF